MNRKSGCNDEALQPLFSILYVEVRLADLLSAYDQIQIAVDAGLQCDHLATSSGGEVIVIVLAITGIHAVIVHFEDPRDFVSGRRTLRIGHNDLVSGGYVEHHREDTGVMSDEVGVLSVCP